jgi:hypothetical protein
VEDRPRLVQVFGPVVEARDGLQWLLEVRGFDLEASPGGGLPAPAADRPEGGHAGAPASRTDTVPPPPPASLSAHVHDGQVLLSWAECLEPDLDGYNVFRTTTPGMRYIQVAAGMVTNRAAFRAGNAGVSYYYVVTARDLSGNESAFSPEAAVQIPGEPARP